MCYKEWNINLPEQIGEEANPKCGIVFVHGFGGAKSTWYEFTSCLNQNWNKEYSFSLYYYQYTKYDLKCSFLSFIKNIVAGGPPIEDLADRLGDYISENCSNHEDIILVCHSMGGLVARKYLIGPIIKYPMIEHVTTLFTFATPHYGSRWANLFVRLQLFFWLLFRKSTRQIREMFKPNKFLIELNDKWERSNIDKNITFKRIFGQCDWIVSSKSSYYKFVENEVVKVKKKNHFNIHKPNNANDIGFKTFFEFLSIYYSEKYPILEQQDKIDQDGDEFE
jgi:hypothetical protein